MILSTQRLKLRPWHPDDKPALLRHAGNRKVSVNLRDRFPFPYTEKDADDWIGFSGPQVPQSSFCMEFGGEAVTLLVPYGFQKFDLTRIFAGVFDWNPASGRVLEKAGFTLESRMRKSVFKDGQVLDQLMYVMIR